MSDRVETLEGRTSLTRREFTLEAALAILAGCVITISDTACSKSTTTPTTTAPPSDVTGNISANHGHTVTITGAQIAAGTAIVALGIQGTAPHQHTVDVSQADLTALRNRQTVTITSTTGNNHTHTVTFTPV